MRSLKERLQQLERALDEAAPKKKAPVAKRPPRRRPPGKTQSSLVAIALDYFKRGLVPIPVCRAYAEDECTHTREGKKCPKPGKRPLVSKFVAGSLANSPRPIWAWHVATI